MQEPPASEASASEPRVVGGDLVPLARDLVAAAPAEGVAALPSSTARRPRWLKPIAGILIAYGVAGLMMAVILLVVGLQLWPTLQLLTTQISGALRATAITVGTAAAAAGGASTSLDQAQQVTATASQTALQASNNVRQLAQTLNIQVFGAQPFGDLVPRFSDMADSLQQLGTSLAGTSQSLAQNSQQTAAMRTNLTMTQQQLTRLADTIDAGFSGVGLPVLLLAGVLWVLMLVQGLLTLVAGVLLLWKPAWWTTP